MKRIRETERKKETKQTLEVKPIGSAVKIIENLGFYEIHEALYELLREY